MALKLAIITPERTMYEGEADGVTLPTLDGEITILSDHEPLISLVSSGELMLFRAGGVQHMAVHGGLVQVLNGEVKILTDVAELEEEIDERRAAEALEQARKTREQANDDIATADAIAAMERALVRLRVAERRKQRHQA
jgi:F-type H+-transporting ATPase subunit epsilon